MPPKPPDWIPARHAMQKYCEPYFIAVEKWRNYDSLELVQNRIQMIETALKILSELSQQNEKYRFDLVFENSHVQLLDEVIPSPGKEFVEGGDLVALQAVQASYQNIAPQIFQRVGVFFQGNLLKPIAGWSDSVLKTSNHDTRNSAICALEKLFRVPESGGMVHFVYIVSDSSNGNQDSQKYLNYPTSPLSESGKEFFDFLAQVHKRKFQISPVIHQTNNSTREMWVTEHESIGKAVASYFKLNGKQQLFKGKITKYLPPSKPNENDQLYHVDWEDGDEQTIEEREYRLFTKLFEDNKEKEVPTAKQTTHAENNKPKSVGPKEGSSKKRAKMECSDSPSPRNSKARKSQSAEAATTTSEDVTWTRRHDSVDREVAGIFEVPSGKKGRKEKKAFKGKITRYCPPSKPKAQDQLYHVLWEDGDEQDFDEAEYRKGVELFIAHFTEDIQWVTDHPSVGKKVAAYFTLSAKKKKLFFGEVKKYGPPSEPEKRDQLYHVVWDDGDEEDYDEDDFQAGCQLYEANNKANQSPQTLASQSEKASSFLTAENMPQSAIVSQTLTEFEQQPCAEPIVVVSDQTTSELISDDVDLKQSDTSMEVLENPICEISIEEVDVLESTGIERAEEVDHSTSGKIVSETFSESHEFLEDSFQ
jgi:hypothetical protein